GGGFNEGAVNFGWGGVKRLAKEQSCEPLVHQDGAVSIVPIEREQAGSPGLEFGSAFCQFFVGAGLFAARLDTVHKPIENITDGRLTSLKPEISWQHTAIHDAAKTGNVRQIFCAGPNRDVAGTGADDFDQSAGS